MTSQFIVGSKGDTGAQGPAVSDGDKGDVTVSAGGTVYTIDPGAVTLAKMANVATASIFGRVTAGTGVPEALTKAQALSILNVADGANVTQTGVETLTNKRISLIAGAAGAGLAPLKFTSGSLLATQEIGADEFNGESFSRTIDLVSGRGMIPLEHRFRLTAAGTAITTIANFFGTNGNIPLVPSSYYEIEVYLWFLKNTAGTVTWTLTNSSAPTGQNIEFEMSPITGIVAPPGTATALFGQFYNDATAARAWTTGSLTTTVNHFAKIKIRLNNNLGTSLKIQATVSAGDIIPGINSHWIAKRVSNSNVGNGAA